jgi:hypothetical protein
MYDLRDNLIAGLCPGKSFIDIGGLWGLESEKITKAHIAGASSLTLLDSLPLTNASWRKFEERRRYYGVREVELLCMNLFDHPDDIKYQVVHSSGLLYHMPNPLEYLRKLRTITSEHLILTSVILPTEVSNEHGSLNVPNGGMLFVPALDDDQRGILNAHYGGVVSLGLRDTCKFDLDDYGPWWMIPTYECFKSMCCVSGFKIMREGVTWGKHCVTFLCE